MNPLKLEMFHSRVPFFIFSAAAVFKSNVSLVEVLFASSGLKIRVRVDVNILMRVTSLTYLSRCGEVGGVYVIT